MIWEVGSKIRWLLASTESRVQLSGKWSTDKGPKN